MRSIVSLTFGFIPKNWDGNSQGVDNIEVGNSDFNNNVEVTFLVTNNSISVANLANDNFDFEDQSEIGEDEELANKILDVVNRDIKVKVDYRDFCECMRVHMGFDDWDEVENKKLKSITWKGPEFSGVKALKLLNYVYVHTQSEDSDFEDIIIGVKLK